MGVETAPAQGVDTVGVDVEDQPGRTAEADLQLEPLGTWLFGADRHADRGGGVDLGVAAAVEEEELVWRDHEVGRRRIARETVGDELGSTTGQRRRLDEPPGDVGHEGVAGGGDVDLDGLHQAA